MDYSKEIQKSVDYIEEHLCEKIDLGKVAKQSHFSKFYFHRLFHKVVGEPMAEYIRKRRLEEAANDLVETREKVTEIALKYQFSSQESFSRAFKKSFGMTPREYRNMGLVLKQQPNIQIMFKANQKLQRQRSNAIRMAA
ncbi:MAG: AraC family transcriptional regulator [Clostridia bacterium]|nr:AraC family transcriptional regulator [Clostridia bacterium]